MGARWAVTTEILLIAFEFGACWGYLVLLTDMIKPLVIKMLGCTDSVAVIYCMLGSGAVCYSLSLLRRVSALRYASGLACAATLFMVVMLVRQSLMHPCEPGDCDDERDDPKSGWEHEGDRGVALGPRDFGSIAAALPLIAFALQTHLQVPAVYSEIPVSLRTPRFGMYFAIATYTILICLYTPAGIAGYSRFGSETQGDILTNFTIDDKLADIARFGIAVTTLCAYPMQHFPARSALYTWWRQRYPSAPPEMSRLWLFGEATVWNALALGLALVAGAPARRAPTGTGLPPPPPPPPPPHSTPCRTTPPDAGAGLNNVLGLIGALCGSFVIFIIPGILCARAHATQPDPVLARTEPALPSRQVVAHRRWPLPPPHSHRGRRSRLHLLDCRRHRFADRAHWLKRRPRLRCSAGARGRRREVERGMCVGWCRERGRWVWMGWWGCWWCWWCW